MAPLGTQTMVIISMMAIIGDPLTIMSQTMTDIDITKERKAVTMRVTKVDIMRVRKADTTAERKADIMAERKEAITEKRKTITTAEKKAAIMEERKVVIMAERKADTTVERKAVTTVKKKAVTTVKEKAVITVERKERNVKEMRADIMDVGRVNEATMEIIMATIKRKTVEEMVVKRKKTAINGEKKVEVNTEEMERKEALANIKALEEIK